MGLKKAPGKTAGKKEAIKGSKPEVPSQGQSPQITGINIRTYFAVILALQIAGMAALIKYRYMQRDMNLASRGFTECDLAEVRDNIPMPEKEKFIPVTIHRILPSQKEYGGVYGKFIEQGISALNKAYGNLHYSFFVKDIRDVHDDGLFDNLKNNPKVFSEKLEALGRKNAVADQLNIFILPSVAYEIQGMAFGALLDLLGEKGDNQIFISYDDKNSWPEELFAHEVGHLFGLKHPHNDRLAGNKDCAITDDFLCDTPADPGPYDKILNPQGCEVDSKCEIVKCGVDPKGVNYTKFPPKVDNYMSYYNGCGRSFTTEQEKVINCTAQKSKGNLLHDSPDAARQVVQAVRVNCGGGSATTIQQGIERAEKEGANRVEICGGTYHEELLIRGIQTEKWFKEKFALDLTVEAAKNPDGSRQNVVVDGDGKRRFMVVQLRDDEKNDKERSSDVFLTVRGITFTGGFVKSTPVDQRETIGMTALFNFTYAQKIRMEEVIVRDSRTENLIPVINVLGNATLRNCEFRGNNLNGGSMFSSPGDYTLENVAFYDNRSVYRDKKAGQKKGYAVEMQMDADADMEKLAGRFIGVRYGGNTFDGVRFVIMPGSNVPIDDQYWKKIKEVTIKNPVTDGVCRPDKMKCE